jgi:hypothetical protein
MKRFLIFASVCAFALTVFQSGRADVSINFFYDNLNGGNWYEVADYGYVWQPDAATNADWRPYTDGYWAYTDVGWTWVSYEDFGWATYHYGRWINLENYGWCWVPGYEWGPAWVSWRTGGDYIGWAPLPPAGPSGEIVYEGRPIGGHVDVEFGIGPAYYNFIDIRFIGEPVLIGHYYPYNQNVVYINNTVNVTNITYNNSVVYNYGPDYALLSRYSTRPIQRLKLERTSIDPLQAVKAGNVTKVQGDKLVLAAPMKLQKGTTQVAPKAIKAKITQPKVEKGWANIADPGAKAKLEQKLKAENPKNIPPPTIQPKAATANVSPLPSPSASGFEKGKGKHKGETQNQVGASVAPGISPGTSAGSFEQEHGKKGKHQRLESEAAASAAPGSSPVTESFEQGKGKHKGQKFENESAVSGGPASSSPAEYPEQGKGKHKGQKFENGPATSGGPATSSPAEYSGQGKGKKKGHGESGEQNAGYGMSPQGSNANPQNENNPEHAKHKGNKHDENAQPGSQTGYASPGGYGGGKHHEQIQPQGQPQGGQYGQQQGGQQQGGQQQGSQDQGKGKGKKGSPTPPPQ